MREKGQYHDRMAAGNKEHMARARTMWEQDQGFGDGG